MKPLILKHVTICLAGGKAPLIKDLDLTVEPGEVVTIMGRSGIGKSTLLAFIGGHLDGAFEANGQVLIGEEDLTARAPEKRRIGLLFQDDLLFPHLSVGDNLAFGLVRHVKGKAERQGRVEEALERAGLSGFANRDPATLSGGQRARVALMRTLLAEPMALLLDEPFSKLDNGLRDDVRQFVFAHAREEGLPVLMVTHDEGDAVAAGGRVIKLAASLNPAAV
ncbi:ATP-binding cassette domain-containing protein [Peteryoungia desertarenae]|uniref:ATP-binding cassette domain-containing protein n=1 Tax=Peteryoungia desertarenae TaxID=1813451 RepID=A0ABX6QKD1_9HYPH|nr:ATP-binding cassette domain-containing protein [Peteryoungia desertarenae]QLF68934.1 ATP-binding cassette domain-containing protein [Peteryoungia desertarenae]